MKKEIKGIKKVVAICLTVLSVLSLMACSISAGNTGGSSEKKIKVGFIQMIENGAFDDMREGFIKQLQDEGYTEDKLEIIYKTAQGDASTLNTIVQEMSDGSYDVVAAVGTPASQSFVNVKSETPLVFISVSDPISAGIVTTMEEPDNNATGTSNDIPIDGIVQLAEELTPGIKRFGLLYNSSEANSVSTVNRAKTYMHEQGYETIEAVVTNSSEVKQVVQGLVSDVDAIFIPNDSVIQNAMPTVTETAIGAQIPVYGSSAVMVDSGSLATVAIGDKEIGAISADMAIEILQGKTPAEIPAVKVGATETLINKKTAEAIEIEIPREIEEVATIIEQ